jgi:ribosome biogenesis GTPase A
VNQIIPRAKVILNDQIQKQIDRGMKPRPIRALIVGIPNVGKSTLINRLAGRKVAITGDRPGVTKGQQWIKVGTEMELLDTPGILWPKFEDMDVGLRLAATGAIKEEVLNVEDIAFQTIRYMIDAYPNALMERYHIEQLPEEIEDPQAVIAVMEAIGRRRGTLQAGGIVNLEKASIAFLRDLKDGKLGRITLELPRLKHIH